MVLNPNPMRKVKVIECEVWSRVVGYYRPMERFNVGKKHEFENRHLMEVENDGKENKRNKD